MGRPPYCNCLCSGVTTTTTTVIPPTTTTTVSPPSTTTTTLEPPIGRCCFLDEMGQPGCIDGVTQQYCQNLWGVTYLNWYKDAYCPCDSTTTTIAPPVTTTTEEPQSTTTTTTKSPFYWCCGVDCDTSPPTYISVGVENCEDCPPATSSCRPWNGVDGVNCGSYYCPPTTTPSPTTEAPPTTTVEPIPGTTTLAPTTTVSPTTTTAAPTTTTAAPTTTTTAAPTTTTAAPGTTTTPAPTTTIAPGTTQDPAAGPYGWSCQPAGGCLYVLNGEFATAEECAGSCW